MDGIFDSRAHQSALRRRPQPRIDAAAKASFLAALRKGAPREESAARAGFSLTGFYGARRRDPAFAAGWAAALALPPAGARRAKAYEERGAPGEIRIAPANRRLVQRRRRRHVRFTAARRGEFLGHFAETGDAKAAAAAVGVCVSTVSYHRRVDRAFAALYREALATAYARLEALAIGLALLAQARLRHAMETHGADLGSRSSRAKSSGVCRTCGHRQDEAEAFDRAMRLLARHDRRQRRVEKKFRPGGRRREWTFERAIEELDKWFVAMGIPVAGEDEGPSNPPRNGEGDRPPA
jgi:hypothetical protein